MTFDLLVGIIIISIIVFGVLFRKPMQDTMVRKLAKTFIDVFIAQRAKKHTYQRGAYTIPGPDSTAFYQQRQQDLESRGCRHVGDTENISLRPILPNGGYFQRHFINQHNEMSISLFHVLFKQKRQQDLVHGMSASTLFNTGTIITSISAEKDNHQLPSNGPSQIIFNAIPFETSAADFMAKHQHEVDLYLDNRDGSSVSALHDLEDCLRLANEKQLLIHEHAWQQGEPIDENYIRQNIDPRFSDLVPEIKREVDKQLIEQDLR